MGKGSSVTCKNLKHNMLWTDLKNANFGKEYVGTSYNCKLLQVDKIFCCKMAIIQVYMYGHEPVASWMVLIVATIRLQVKVTLPIFVFVCVYSSIHLK